MLPFSVEVEGLTEEGQGKWVLAVDAVGDRLLLVNEDKSLYWHPMAECSFHGMVQPGAPQPVMLVEPQQQGPALLTPNRATRRHPLGNGA
jgi:hypothetical protein